MTDQPQSKPAKSLLMLAAACLLTLALTVTQASKLPGAPMQGRPQEQLRPFPNQSPPRDDLVAAQAAGIRLGDSPEDAEILQAWYAEFNSRNEKAGPNPRAYQERMARLVDAETAGMSPSALNAGEAETAKMLIIPFEFAGTDDIETCDGTGSFVGMTRVTGPLHGEIPNPTVSGDNNSIWTEGFNIQWYEDLIFGDGVGIIRKDLNDGSGFDLSGASARNWYAEQSEGLYDLSGEVYAQWVQLNHSVAWYGWESDELNPQQTGYSCKNTPSGRGSEFVNDIVDQINAANPGFDWAQWDVDKDQIVDHLMVVHAGVDNSATGGDYGNFQIWAHSWDAATKNPNGSYSYGYLADNGGTPSDPSDDIYVGNYTVIPEDAGIGVIVHEYGHDIGLPDYYDTSGVTSNSAAQWINMSSGSWNGALGQSHPAPFSPWARFFLGWSDPIIIAYDDPEENFIIGQSDPTPEGTADAVWITLPDQSVTVENRAGKGSGLRASAGNGEVQTIQRAFDLRGTEAPLFSFATAFDIEENWDYAFLAVSTDGGQSWSGPLLNDQGVFATADLNGSPAWPGPGSLSGQFAGRLTYDLSAYAGERSLLVSINYAADHALQGAGMWIDDLSLDDGGRNLYASDLQNSADWIRSAVETAGSGWQIVPNAATASHFYMLEWRNDHGSIASDGHSGQYYSLAHDDAGWLVDKFSANVPGLLIWYRNNTYGNNRVTASGRQFDPPATGPKGELLLVDAHYEPVTWSGGWWDGENDVPAKSFSNRRAAMDGAFTLAPTPPWLIHDYAVGSSQVFDFGSRAAVSSFHDSMRSVPGWIMPDPTGEIIYPADLDASVVIPGSDYSTRIRGLAGDGVTIGDDLAQFWGSTVQGQAVGSGHPGDALAHHGVHIELVEAADDGSYGVVRFHNDRYEADSLVDYGAQGSADEQWIASKGEAAASIQIRNAGGMMEDVLVLIELPANVDYIAGSMDKGLIGIGRASAKNLAKAASYVKQEGFDNLLAGPEPQNVRFIALSAEAFATGSEQSLGYAYRAEEVGAGSPETLIVHAEGSLKRPLAPLTVRERPQESTFLPLVRGN